jgi:hypothetical protein
METDSHHRVIVTETVSHHWVIVTDTVSYHWVIVTETVSHHWVIVTESFSLGGDEDGDVLETLHTNPTLTRLVVRKYFHYLQSC